MENGMPRVFVFITGCVIGYILGGYLDGLLDDSQPQPNRNKKSKGKTMSSATKHDWGSLLKYLPALLKAVHFIRQKAKQWGKFDQRK